jgi:PAS domain S-box-containing protein
MQEPDNYLAAVHENSLAVSEHTAASDLLEQIAERAAQAVGTTHGIICLIEHDPNTMLLRGMLLRVGVGAGTGVVGVRVVRGEGLSGQVWQRAGPVTVDDYDRWEGRAASIPKATIHAALGVPLLSHGRVAGVLSVAHTDPDRRFSDAEVQQASRFGELASTAMQNTRMYAQAKHAKTRYRTLTEQIPAVVSTEPSGFGGARTYLNRQVEPLLGYPLHQAEQPNFWSSRLHPNDREKVLANQARCQQTRQRFSMEYRLRHRDGQVVWVRDQCRLIGGDASQPPLWQCVAFDITQTKRSKQATRQALRRTREAAQRLRALDELKNGFLDGISHELRTPLAAVEGIAMTLQRAGSSLAEADSAELLARLVGSARKLDRLLADLLDLDRLRRGTMLAKRRPTNVGALVGRLADQWRMDHQRQLHTQLEPVVVWLDPAKVERIVENLLANAARHTPVDTPVWVRVNRDGEGVQIAVEDAGTGVPPELRASVFEPFQQGPSTPTHAPGVGIGLSLVVRFAKLHGGRAWVEDRHGGGSSFRVFIPNVPEQPTSGEHGPA